MPLTFHPKAGEILLCDFATGFRPPEMVKRRPVVVVSPRLRQRERLVAVVPLSTTEPRALLSYHAVIELDQPLPAPFQAPRMWAKADMLATVSFDRLDRFRKRLHSGGRQYVSGQCSPDQLRAVRVAMLHGLGLDSLTIHL